MRISYTIQSLFKKLLMKTRSCLWVTYIIDYLWYLYIGMLLKLTKYNKVNCLMINQELIKVLNAFDYTI